MASSHTPAHYVENNEATTFFLPLDYWDYSGFNQALQAIHYREMQYIK
jgi:hypothetical protein